VARFLTIYIEEAHARDEWWLPYSPEASTRRSVYAHKNIGERLQAANRFVNDTGFPLELVCDSFDGNVVDRYRGWPERLFIIVDGVVVYRGGEGPFGYKLIEVEQWLEKHYGKREDPVKWTPKNGDDDTCSTNKCH